MGQKEVSLLVRCPYFRGCNVHKQGVWDSQMCPVASFTQVSWINIAYKQIRVYITLTKLVAKKENPDLIHHARTIQTRKHTMNRTPGCPPLRTGMVS